MMNLHASEQSDQYHGFELNAVAAAHRRLDDRMLEFHRDQQGHDRSEYRPKDLLLERTGDFRIDNRGSFPLAGHR